MTTMIETSNDSLTCFPKIESKIRQLVVDPEEPNDDSGTFTGSSTCSSYVSTTRRLRFDTDEHIIELIPIRSEIEAEQKQRIWWGKKDYRMFSETAKNISKEVRHHESLTSGIDCAYKRSEKASKSTKEESVEETVQNLAVNSELVLWCSHGHSRRGLERWGSELHSTLRTANAKGYKSNIVEMQRSLIDDEELRHVAESHSRLARIFARLMGEADATAVRRQENATTYMRRWSDLGGSTQRLERAREPWHRTASLPQRSWSTMDTNEDGDTDSTC